MDTSIADSLHPIPIIVSLVIGIVAGVISVYVMSPIERFRSYRNKKVIQRTIENAEREKQELSDLAATSDRLILLRFLRSLFEFVYLVAAVFIVTALCLFHSSSRNTAYSIAIVIWCLFWLLIGGGAVIEASTLNKLSKYPETIESINRKIAELNARCIKLTGSKDSNS